MEGVNFLKFIPNGKSCSVLTESKFFLNIELRILCLLRLFWGINFLFFILITKYPSNNYQGGWPSDIRLLFHLRGHEFNTRGCQFVANKGWKMFRTACTLMELQWRARPLFCLYMGKWTWSCVVFNLDFRLQTSSLLILYKLLMCINWVLLYYIEETLMFNSWICQSIRYAL